MENVHIHELLVDDGGGMTILIHKGKKEEDSFLKDGTIPDPSSTHDAEFKIVQTTIKRQLEGRYTDKRIKIVNTYGSFWGDPNVSSQYVHYGEDRH